MRRQGNAANLHCPSWARRPSIDGSLQVDMLKRGQFTRHHGMVHAIRSQEIAHQHRNLIGFPAGNRVDPVQKTAKRRRELAGLTVWRLIGHALDLQLRWPLPTAGTRSRAYRRGSVTAATPSPPATHRQLTPGPPESDLRTLAAGAGAITGSPAAAQALNPPARSV